MTVCTPEPAVGPGAAQRPDGVAGMADGGVVVFVCNWVPSIGADNAALVEATYPANTTILPVACTGRLTPGILLRTFGSGAQAVLVVGCALEECHYVSGSHRCTGVIEETRELLPLVGVDPDLLGFELLSETDGRTFAKTVSDFVAVVESRVRAAGV
jgi:coenzyme F420-reducing hydrogenase delta subunit